MKDNLTRFLMKIYKALFDWIDFIHQNQLDNQTMTGDHFVLD